MSMRVPSIQRSPLVSGLAASVAGALPVVPAAPRAPGRQPLRGPAEPYDHRPLRWRGGRVRRRIRPVLRPFNRRLDETSHGRRPDFAGLGDRVVMTPAFIGSEPTVAESGRWVGNDNGKDPLPQHDEESSLTGWR